MKKLLKKIKILFLGISFSLMLIPQNVSAQEKIRIGFLDTGVFSEMFEKDTLAIGYNFVEDTEDTSDLIGHGTAVSSIWLCSKYSLDNAVIVPFVVQTKVEDKIVSLTADELAVAIIKAIDVYNCDILNISMGITQTSDALTNAVLYAEEKNVIILSAVGNDGDDRLYYPATYETVIGIGSLDISGNPSKFSQENASLALVAQGEGLEITGLEGKDILTNGTSYATAVATAEIVPYVRQNEKIDAKTLRTALYRTAIDINSFGYDQKTGYGKIDTKSANDYLINHGEQLTNPKENDQESVTGIEENENNLDEKNNGIGLLVIAVIVCVLALFFLIKLRNCND